MKEFAWAALGIKYTERLRRPVESKHLICDIIVDKLVLSLASMNRP
jgi:hypothetical protein